MIPTGPLSVHNQIALSRYSLRLRLEKSREDKLLSCVDAGRRIEPRPSD